MTDDTNILSGHASEMRISIDTFHDWHRVQKSFSDVALQIAEEKIAARINGGGRSGNGNGKEGLRDKELLLAHVREVSECPLTSQVTCDDLGRILKQLIAKTLEMAGPNLRVNGRNFEDFEQTEQGELFQNNVRSLTN